MLGSIVRMEVKANGAKVVVDRLNERETLAFGPGSQVRLILPAAELRRLAGNPGASVSVPPAGRMEALG